ncbi:UNVERIFIED_CONTAM: hypothetical protein GTU68_024152 [Idotea baltica]|nr:hypothetical protein [Idotea baltica]
MRFPIGEFELPAQLSQSSREECMDTIASFAADIHSLTTRLNDTELAKTYRPDGWNIRQLVHHCADSHMNAFIRFKLALTEDKPSIKPYEEARWAELSDTLNMPIDDSLAIIKGVHSRWSVLLNTMDTADFERVYIHPEHGQLFRLDQALANYDWHCKHHLAHINIALTS